MKGYLGRLGAQRTRRGDHLHREAVRRLRVRGVPEVPRQVGGQRAHARHRLGGRHAQRVGPRGGGASTSTRRFRQLRYLGGLVVEQLGTLLRRLPRQRGHCHCTDARQRDAAQPASHSRQGPPAQRAVRGPSRRHRRCCATPATATTSTTRDRGRRHLGQSLLKSNQERHLHMQHGANQGIRVRTCHTPRRESAGTVTKPWLGMRAPDARRRRLVHERARVARALTGRCHPAAKPRRDVELSAPGLGIRALFSHRCKGFRFLRRRRCLEDARIR